MTHALLVESNTTLKTISVTQKSNAVTISISNKITNSHSEHMEIEISKKDLHSWIGTLLHVQSKIK